MSQDSSFGERLKRRRFLRTAGALGAAGMAGCLEDLQGGGDGGGGTVDVGVVVPYSGDLSDFGGPMQNGFELAREDINDAGGPNGMNVELHFEDSNSQSTQGVNAANKLVDTTGVDALFGAVSSGVTISIAESVTVPNEVLHVTPASSSPVISTLDDDDYVWRTRTNDRFVARVMSRIAENNDASSAAVLYVNNDFGSALADVFEESFEGEVTAKVGYESGASSYQQSLETLFADSPDYVALAGYPESGTTILSQWYEGGYGGNWVLHTSLLSDDVIQNVGADVMDGMYGVRTMPPSGDDTQNFVDDYESAYPDAQLFSPYSWNSYDALVSWALAAHSAGSVESADVKEQMRPVTNPPGEAVGYGEFESGVDLLDDDSDVDYSGPSGNVNYDENGDVASDMVVAQVVDGEFEDQETIPASELV
ncbi:ABC transporter substrate-binding protein [Halobacterium wangiae]|uniref:ABC transporter substrate-binding protein n=1 Tax=Halobacterium wangiae TaxID=2902623 RepID=UPI001E61A631|nr:ABC transporter substrate-binding protein [Halobacterium wangiae]